MSPSSAEGSTGNREQAVKKSGKRVNPADVSATAYKRVEYSADSKKGENCVSDLTGELSAVIVKRMDELDASVIKHMRERRVMLEALEKIAGMDATGNVGPLGCNCTICIARRALRSLREPS